MKSKGFPINAWKIKTNTIGTPSCRYQSNVYYTNTTFVWIIIQKSTRLYSKYLCLQITKSQR